MNENLDRYPELLLDLLDKGAEAMVEFLKLERPVARHAAFLVTEVIRREWSGDQLYLAKGLAYEINRRDREMYAKFTGANHAALAKEYGITTRQVYDRLAMVGDQEFKRRQPGLFEG
jgi:Mor family transcriptional regulator